MTATVCGVAIGVSVALRSAKAIAGQLFGAAPTHPATLIAAVAALFAVGVLASFIPARRAARVNPLIAIRAE